MENQNTQTAEKKVNDAVINNKAKENASRYDSLGFLRPLFGLFDDDFFDNEETNAYGLMKTDITDNKDNYQLEVEVPGIKKEDIKLSLEKGYLTVSYKIEEKKTENVGKKIHSERKTSGIFRRDFFVGYNVKKNEITASLTDGILNVTVPKETAQADADRFIEIK